MRSFTQIIADAGGYQVVAERVGVSAERARFWARRNGIPPSHWHAVTDARVSSLEELAQAAEARRLARTADAAA